MAAHGSGSTQALASDLGDASPAEKARLFVCAPRQSPAKTCSGTPTRAAHSSSLCIAPGTCT